MTRKRISEKDRRYIIGRSGGLCNICRQSLFLEGDFHETARIGDDAHIFAASDKGPRANNCVSRDSRAHIGNLILLCKNCHSKVDQQPKEYSEDKLLEYRDRHYTWVEESLGKKIAKKPIFHYLTYINIPRVDMYAVVNSISIPATNLSNARSIRDLGMQAGLLMANYVNVLNHEDLYANTLVNETKIDARMVGSYFFSESATFRTKNIDDTKDIVKAWEKSESIIYRNFGGWRLNCLIDPRWITTQTAYVSLRSGTLQTMGLFHVNHVNLDRGEAVASPLFLGAADGLFL